jgi:hypothetical protein
VQAGDACVSGDTRAEGEFNLVVGPVVEQSKCGYWTETACSDEKGGLSVSCEVEEQAAEQARIQYQIQQQMCDQLAIEKMNPNDPEVLLCRADQERAQTWLGEKEAELRACRAAAEAIVTRTAEGRVTFLRVHEPGTGYGGGSSNHIDADVIFKLDLYPDEAFGFQLRDDPFRPVREGMLSLLRTAIATDWRVRTDYDQLVQPPNQNSFAVRVALVRPQPSQPGEVFE